MISPGHSSYVHHMVLYECHVPSGDDGSAAWFERHVGSGGERCYSPNMPPEWTFCLATNTLAWVRKINLRMDLFSKSFSRPGPVLLDKSPFFEFMANGSSIILFFISGGGL